MRIRLHFFLLTALFFTPAALPAQEAIVTLDPSATQVHFTLGATLHTVHGSFKLKSGEIHLDPATGKASGAVILDATSGETGNDSRDKKMHGDILESARFPEIAFVPSLVEGSISNVLAGKKTQLQISGVIRLHGQGHDAALAISVESAPDGKLHATTKFTVPYIQWGLKSPNTFLLHVSDTVDLDIDAVGTLVLAPGGEPTTRSSTDAPSSVGARHAVPAF